MLFRNRYTSSNTSVGTINLSTGVFTAVAIGTVNITATNGGVSGTATVTVTAEAGLPQTGDINGNGAVTLADAIYLAKHVAGTSGYETLY